MVKEASGAPVTVKIPGWANPPFSITDPWLLRSPEGDRITCPPFIRVENLPKFIWLVSVAERASITSAYACAVTETCDRPARDNNRNKATAVVMRLIMVKLDYEKN
jgi:hypothetical protein